MPEKMPGKRVLLSSEATYRLAGGVVPPVSVMVNELSLRGVKFVTTNQLAPGTAIEMKIFFTNTSDPINVQARVVSQKAISSRFLIDTFVEFVEVLARDKSRLDAFLSHETENIKMGRAHLRCVMTSPVHCRLVEQPAKIISCFSGDISVTGIKLFLHQRLGVDKEVALEFELPGRRADMRLKGRIIWEKETVGEVWATGVKFLEISSVDKDHIIRFMNHTLSKT